MLFVPIVDPYKKAFQPRWRTDIYAAWHLRAGAIPERAVLRQQRPIDRADWIVTLDTGS